MRAPTLYLALAAALLIGRFGPAAGADDDIHKRQEELAQFAAQPSAEGDLLLRAEFDRYRAHDLPPALWLELFAAAAKSGDSEVKAQLAAHEREIKASRDPLSAYRECLEGGDATAGRAVFAERPEAGCVRCHRVNGQGGEIGPDLSTLRQATQRIFILESIVDPNAIITLGFQNVLLTLKDGETLSGLVTFESSETLVLRSVVDGKSRTLPVAEIAGRTPLPSAMPPGFGLVLGKRAIRDLVEFLATAE